MFKRKKKKGVSCFLNFYGYVYLFRFQQSFGVCDLDVIWLGVQPSPILCFDRVITLYLPSVSDVISPPSTPPLCSYHPSPRSLPSVLVLPWCLPFGQQSSRAAVTVHDRPSINAELFDESPCGACAGADVLMILTCSADLTCTLSFTATRYLPPLYATRGSFGPGNI